MTSIDRTAYPRFARRLSEEELEERYSLTTDEYRFVDVNARSESGRLTLAIMLKARQQLGYFPGCSEVPDQVRRHLIEKLGLPEETLLLDEVRQKSVLYRLLFRRLFGRWFRRLFGAADGQISRIDRSFRWIAGGVVVRPPALRLSDDSAMKDGDTRRACLSACFT